MFHPENSHIDPETGNVSYRGPLERNKGSHAHMPARTEAYLPGGGRKRPCERQFPGGRQ